MPRLRRYQVDREAVSAACLIWWQAEHGAPPPWNLEQPGAAEVPTAERVRTLVKKQRPETPGDVAVLAALPRLETESAARLKALRDAEAWLNTQPTAVVLRALGYARSTGEATMVLGGNELVPGRVRGNPVFSREMIKRVLDTREHVLNRPERKLKRLASAAKKRGERPPRSRR